MNISVIGTGYVGLVSGICFSETGNNVVCVDIDEKKINSLNDGQIPIYEPGLETLFERNVRQGRIEFTTDLAKAVSHAEIIFLALPTPPGEDGSADLSYVLKAAGDIAELIEEYKVIVNKSTVPIGTAEKVRAVFSNITDITVDVVSNPEFLREGKAVDDFLKPDRVVIGSSSEKAKVKMKVLYEPFVRQGNPIYFMDVRSAEMTKYAANSYLATRITFMNEIANLCEKVGADVDMVRIGMGSDNRIGKRFLFPGIGYGGSCFPKDVLALATAAEQSEYDFNILKSVISVNEKQKFKLIPKVKNYFGESLSGKKFALWGLAFKPDTDDIREAPSLYTINSLLDAGAEVSAYDPEAMTNVKEIFGDKIHFATDPYEAIQDADALLIATEWSAFRTPDFNKMGELLKNKVIFDGRNVYSLEQMQELGFYYDSIGRAIVGQEAKV